MYVIDQKVGKYTYVYEVYGYWDKEKKAPRQKRIRIGKRDPDTGEFIEYRSRRVSREYGPVYFLASVIDAIGVRELIEEHFPEHAREIILAACFQIAEHDPFYLCNSWLERIYLKQPCSLSSQKLSRLFHDIGGRDRDIYRFQNAWAAANQGNEFIVFDITSISSYSKQLDFAEWGYNRDREKLPQVNLGVVYGEPENLPLLYGLYPGSVPDVSTLDNLKKRIQSISSVQVLFVLDRGFYSGANINLLAKQEGKFIIPLPMRINVAKELVKAYRGNIGTTENAFRFGSQLLYSVSDTVCIGESHYTVHMFFNESQSAEQKEKLISFLLSVEEEVAQRQWSSAASLITFLDNNLPDWRPYFKVAGVEDDYTVERKKEAIERKTLQLGMFILMTNTDLSAQQVLTYYRRKDGVEKLFDSLKHDIDGKRLRVHSRQSMEGLLFVDFISLIILSFVRKRLRECGLDKKLTVKQLFYELKKLSVIEIDEKTPIVSELTRKQKDIFEAFELPLPVST